MRRREGLSSVFGFLVIFMILIAGLSSAAAVVSSQDSVWKAQQQANQLDSTRKLEHLSLSLNGSSLVIRNDGLVPSQLEYLLRSANGSTSDGRLTELLPVGDVSSLPVQSQLSGYAVVTDLGNVFWLQDPAQSPAATVPVTFDASGLPLTFNSSSVLTVDGQPILYADLPRTYEWQPGTSHSYAFSSGLSLGPSERVGWTSARGLDQARNGTLAVAQPGTIVSQYDDQYLLTVVGGGSVQYVGSPGGDGWYDAGSTAQVSSSYSWNQTQGQSRQNLVSWDFDGSSSAALPRAGSGTFETPGVVMDSPHTLYLNSVTQYHVSAAAGVPSSGGEGSLTVSYSYDTAQTTVSQGFTDAGFESGSSGWFSETLGSACSASKPGTVVTAYYHSPTHSAELASGQCLFQNIGLPSVSSPSYDHIVSATLSGWMYCPTGGCAPEAYSGANAWCISFADGLGASTSWTQFSVGAYLANCQGGPQAIGMLSNSPGNPFYIDDLVMTYTYSQYISSSTSGSAASFAVSGGTVTYSYGVGYGFPGGSSSASWSSSWPSAEAFASDSCSGAGVSGSTISGAGGPCVLTTTRTGSYSSTMGSSQTGDGWYDSGSSVPISATATGPFGFGGWSTSGGLSIASASSPSTTLTVNGYGTATASISVGQ